MVDAEVKILMDEGCEDLFPTKAHPSDAGFDLKSEQEVILRKGEVQLIPVGFKMKLPEGYEAQIRPRSGLALKEGIMIVNSPGTIDQNFLGKIMIIIRYTGKDIFSSPNTYKVNRGDKIAQMVIQKIPTISLRKVTSLEETDRGERGFGSSGK
jgi:dUTP pyrophosphatase